MVILSPKKIVLLCKNDQTYIVIIIFVKYLCTGEPISSWRITRNHFGKQKIQLDTSVSFSFAGHVRPNLPLWISRH